MSEKYTIEWIMADEPLLKLKEPDETYDIEEKVYKFIKDNKLDDKEDFQVEVKIDKTQGENGLITDLQEVGGTSSSTTEAPKETGEESTETINTGNENLIVKELIVNGVSVDKKSVKFTVDKDNDTWYNLDDSINAQEFKDKCTRKTLEVSIRLNDQGNDVIVGYTVKEKTDTPKDEEEKSKKSSKNSYSNGANATQLSIEAQASINSANRVAQAMITSESKPDDVKKIIRKIAEFNFDLIQEFKNKE